MRNREPVPPYQEVLRSENNAPIPIPRILSALETLNAIFDARLEAEAIVEGLVPKRAESVSKKWERLGRFLGVRGIATDKLYLLDIDSESKACIKIFGQVKGSECIDSYALDASFDMLACRRNCALEPWKTRSELEGDFAFGAARPAEIVEPVGGPID